MRLIPKGLARIFQPIPLPEAVPPPTAREDVGVRIARATQAIGNRMIAAEAATVASHTHNVAALFAELDRRLEERHDR